MEQVVLPQFTGCTYLPYARGHFVRRCLGNQAAAPVIILIRFI
jgi:hypothetical protein